MVTHHTLKNSTDVVTGAIAIGTYDYRVNGAVVEIFDGGEWVEAIFESE